MASLSGNLSWKQLLVCAFESNGNLGHSYFFQLATVGLDGKPANRTVVFRGFQDGSDKILVNTDCRSRKIEDIKHCPYGEICWYFTDSWEQFRISGKIDIIDRWNSEPWKTQVRTKAWVESSISSRLQYMGPTPMLPRIYERPSEEAHLESSEVPAEAFCVLLIDPEQVDYLNLKSNKRLMYTSKKTDRDEQYWMMGEINL